jgi:hypothetical protein
MTTSTLRDDCFLRTARRILIDPTVGTGRWLGIGSVRRCTLPGADYGLRSAIMHRHSIFNEGEDTDSRGIADRLAGSMPVVEVCDHLIFIWYTRARMSCGPRVLRFPSDTGGA